jgi:hypothetical protein
MVVVSWLFQFGVLPEKIDMRYVVQAAALSIPQPFERITAKAQSSAVTPSDRPCGFPW